MSNHTDIEDLRTALIGRSVTSVEFGPTDTPTDNQETCPCASCVHYREVNRLTHLSPYDDTPCPYLAAVMPDGDRFCNKCSFGAPAPAPDTPTYAEGKITLDDGTVLLLGGNVGGCSCGGGDYTLTQLNEMPVNGIMNVEVETTTTEYGDTTGYKIFVLAQDQRFTLAEFQGTDGSGWYGTGFWFTVLTPTPTTS